MMLYIIKLPKKEDTPSMRQNNIHPLEKQQSATLVDDPLTELLRQGARTLIIQAIEADLDTLLARTSTLPDEMGRRRLV